ncbi:HNH endonuclease [Synechococcus sp. BA-132 BA5]|uniref:HNH endonuclease n=1 Tax=Synechococcus sp. BA-132 BA5 TaxID=3110252 RepID=UPI003FCE35BF
MDNMAASRKICRKCGRAYEATREFFGSLSNGNLRGTCRACINENSHNWSQNNQESVRRRSRERQARVDRWVPSSELRQRLFNEQTGLCALCGTPIEDLEAAEVEHLTPAVRGGSNHYSNLALAHVPCNREKTKKTLGEYISWRRLVGLPPSAYSSDKLKKAIAIGKTLENATPSARATRRSREAPFKTSWMPGKEPDRGTSDNAVSRQSAQPSQRVEEPPSNLRNTVYRYVGNIPPDDIRPVPGASPAVKEKAGESEHLNERATRDTTYRLSGQDLTDANFKIN